MRKSRSREKMSKSQSQEGIVEILEETGNTHRYIFSYGISVFILWFLNILNQFVDMGSTKMQYSPKNWFIPGQEMFFVWWILDVIFIFFILFLVFTQDTQTRRRAVSRVYIFFPICIVLDIVHMFLWQAGKIKYTLIPLTLLLVFTGTIYIRLGTMGRWRLKQGIAWIRQLRRKKYQNDERSDQNPKYYFANDLENFIETQSENQDQNSGIDLDDDKPEDAILLDEMNVAYEPEPDYASWGELLFVHGPFSLFLSWIITLLLFNILMVSYHVDPHNWLSTKSGCIFLIFLSFIILLFLIYFFRDPFFPWIYLGLYLNSIVYNRNETSVFVSALICFIIVIIVSVFVFWISFRKRKRRKEEERKEKNKRKRK
eukprot:Anaeramoba_ignava/a351447_16.p1 GENE.a351447_16~~a351447_16.p1  ORF type:complete len:371 (-),score=57.03 a351447_16:19-1131(-)